VALAVVGVNCVAAPEALIFKSVFPTLPLPNLSINQTKLSGQCSRLKCCLNYELDTYLDALQHFPDG
jgi:hypothetical protein